MKRLMILFLTVAMGFGLAVSAQADTWTNVVNLNDMFDGGFFDLDGAINGQIHQGFNTVIYGWQHLTPPDFEVPYDIVTSATLSVWVGWIDTFGDDHFSVQSLSLPLTFNTATYTLGIGSLFVSLWPNGQNLLASLTITEDESTSHPEWNGDLLLGNATLNMEYQNVSVPEPATMLLLGSGLVGLAGFARKKFKK